MAAALAEPAEALRRACRRYEVEFRTLLDHLAFQAADNASPGDMTLLALSKTAGPAATTHVATFAPLVSALLQALATSQPRLADELELRAGPLARNSGKPVARADGTTGPG